MIQSQTLLPVIIISVVLLLIGVLTFLLYKRKDNDNIDYKVLFNESPSLTWMLDIETRKFIMVNDAMLDQYEYTREEFLELRCYDVKIEEEFAELDSYFENINNRREAHFLSTHRSKSGKLFNVDIKTILFNYNGKKAILGTASNITEKLKAENELREYNANISAIVENTDDAIWAVDREGKITVVNESYKKMYKAAFGKEVEIGQDLFRDVAENTSHVRKEMLRRSLNGEKINFEFNIPLNGELRICNASMHPIYLQDGTINGVSYLCRDITDTLINENKIRQSEAKYSKLIESMNDGMIQADENNIVRFANDRFLELVGYSKDEIIGNDNHSLLLEEDGLKLALDKNGQRENGLSDRYELKMRKKDGTYIYVLVYANPYYDEHNKFSGVLATFTDITESKNAEEKIKGINQELDQFAYVVSHDLKAPLRAINNLSMWIEEDLEEVISEETRKSMNLLRGRVGRMEALINGVLDYSRVGRQKVVSEQIALLDLLEEVKDMLSPSEKFAVNLPETNYTFSTERVRLQQVFSNLLSNAIKYHDKGQGRIDIMVNDLGEHFEFIVKDDGPGIEPEYHEKIFVIFQTLQSKDTVESTGVGLSIVKKIIKEAGGNIRVDSKAGEGASFIFTWPKKSVAIPGNMLIAA